MGENNLEDRFWKRDFKFYSDLHQLLIGPSQLFRQSYQNSILRVQRNNFSTIFFRWKFIFHLNSSAETFRNACGYVLAEFSDLQSMYPEEHSGLIACSDFLKVSFSSFVECVARHFCTLTGKIPSMLSKVHSLHSKEHFQWKPLQSERQLDFRFWIRNRTKARQIRNLIKKKAAK